MKKTFKSNSSTRDLRELSVAGWNATGVELIIFNMAQGGAKGIVIPAADAPALALAILEAAYPPADYVLDGSPEAFLAVSAEYLRKASSAIEANTKNTAARAALEADAWTLYESAFPDDRPYPNFERFPEHLRDAWIRVALKAREMKGAGDE